MHKVQTCVASRRCQSPSTFRAHFNFIDMPSSLPRLPPLPHWPWACNRFVAAATNITMPLQQVSQRASQRDLWYIFSASQGSPACLPRLPCLPACLACLLVKFIKYLCGSCLHSFHLAFTYSLSLSFPALSVFFLQSACSAPQNCWHA